MTENENFKILEQGLRKNYYYIDYEFNGSKCFFRYYYKEKMIYTCRISNRTHKKIKLTLSDKPNLKKTLLNVAKKNLVKAHKIQVQAQALTRFRTRRGLTRAQLGRMAGICPGNIKHVENQERGVPDTWINKFLLAFDDMTVEEYNGLKGVEIKGE